MPSLFSSAPASCSPPAGVGSGLSSQGRARKGSVKAMTPIIYMPFPSSTILHPPGRVYLQAMSTATLPQIYSYGHALDMDDDKFGLLRDSSDAATDFPELRRRFATDGYLYMKGYLEREKVLEARAGLTSRLAASGTLDPA